MSFVRSKEIPPGSGNWYDYEVETTHEGEHVRQKVVQYLGKTGGKHAPLKGAIRLSSRMLSGTTLGANAKLAIPKVACKLCGSQHTRKYGRYKDVQNYFCDDCHSKFTGTDALAHGCVSPDFIARALNEFYSGMSFHEIEHGIEDHTDDSLSHTAVIKWVNKFTLKAIRQTQDDLVGDRNDKP
jgi:transposase-like protein